MESSNDLREKLRQTNNILEKERAERQLYQKDFSSSERQQYHQFMRENAKLKNEIEKQAKLNGAMSSKLSIEKKDVQSRESAAKVDLARERAVSETLRQALVDKQIEIENLQKFVQDQKSINERKTEQIKKMTIDLEDANNIVRTSNILMEANSVLSDAARDMRTIISIFDRHILTQDAHENDEQDILDVSRLLSCSLDTKVHENKPQNKKAALKSAEDQLESALKLRQEIDKLRLKLSERWTEHLTSDCHVQ